MAIVAYPAAKFSFGVHYALFDRQRFLFLFLLLCLLGRPFPGLAASPADQERIPLSISRIISLYPAHTENLLSLGLAAEIIGVANGDDAPLVAGKPRFSAQDTAEKFIAAAPDLILIRPMIEQAHPHLISQLQKSGIAVISLQATSIEELYAYWRTMGTLTGKNKEAAAMIQQFKAELASIHQLRDTIPAEKRPRVYFESIHDKMKTFAPSSIAIFVLESAGGVNVAGDATARNSTNIAAYGKERILAKAADIDVYLAQQGQMNRISAKTIAAEAGFQAIKAVRAGQIHLIDEDLVSRPTMRLLEGIRQVRDLLYPEQLTHP